MRKRVSIYEHFCLRTTFRNELSSWTEVWLYITVLIDYCVLTVYNTLYKSVNTQRDGFCQKRFQPKVSLISSVNPWNCYVQMLRPHPLSTDHSNRYLTLFRIRRPWPPLSPDLSPRDNFREVLHNHAYLQGTVDVRRRIVTALVPSSKADSAKFPCADTCCWRGR